MNEKNSKVSKGVLWGIIVVSVLVIIGILLVAYFYFNSQKVVKKENVDGGNIYLTYTDDVCGLTISKVLLTSDAYGKSIDSADLYFDFSVSVNLEEAQNIKYEIALVTYKTTTVDNKYVKVYLEKLNSGSFTSVLEPTFISLESNKTELGSPKGSMVLYTDDKTKSSSDNYRLRLWVSDESEAQLTAEDVLSYKIVVNGKAF